MLSGPPLARGSLALLPARLDRIELRGIGRRAFQVQARVACAQGRQIRVRAGRVDGGAVPDHDDMSTKMLEQIPEKVVDFLMRNVLRIQAEVQAQAPAPGTDRQATDDGDTRTLVAMPHDGGLADRCPGTSDGGNQQEARFVGKDEVGTQPRSVFLG